MFGRLRPHVDLRYYACGTGEGPDPIIYVLRSAGMRDLFGINGAWTEERHDVYECRVFVDWRRDTGANTVRLHSHPVIA